MKPRRGRRAAALALALLFGAPLAAGCMDTGQTAVNGKSNHDGKTPAAISQAATNHTLRACTTPGKPLAVKTGVILLEKPAKFWTSKHIGFYDSHTASSQMDTVVGGDVVAKVDPDYSIIRVALSKSDPRGKSWSTKKGDPNGDQYTWMLSWLPDKNGKLGSIRKYRIEVQQKGEFYASAWAVKVCPPRT